MVSLGEGHSATSDPPATAGGSVTAFDASGVRTPKTYIPGN